MKKILCVMLAVLTLSGCSGVPQADYDALVAERDELKAKVEEYLTKEQEENKETESQTYHSEPTVSKTIDFDGTNNAMVTIYENETPSSASVICAFDGKDAELEFARLMAFTLLLENLEIKDFMISSMVETDDTQTTVIMYKNGEMQPPVLMSEKYREISSKGTTKEFQEMSYNEYGEILELLK